MGDRLRRPVNALTASAKILTATREDAPKPESWHDEAWGFRNTVGELRFAEMWLANSLSRARLVAARRPEPGAEPEIVEDGPAADLVAALAGGVGGQSALLRAFAAHLLTPGVGYLVGEPGPGRGSQWAVHSGDEIRLSRNPDPDTGRRVYEVLEGENTGTDWRQLPVGALPVRVWRPHPRWSYQPDSPVRGALPILRELTLLTQHVEASATSRLAGAGLLVMDSSIEFPDGWDAWVREFLDAVNKPIKDRASAAAYTPFPVKIPGPVKDKVLHLMFNTPFDEHSLKLRDEAIGRLATAMDMPKRALTGEQENHWGKWATTEEGITLHVEPNLELICDGLTKGYLTPGLVAGQSRGIDRRVRLLREPQRDADGSELIVWYDTTELRVRPDKSDDTVLAYDRWEVSGDELRQELGLADATAPAGQEFERRVWIQMLDNPQLAPLALQRLGLADGNELPITVTEPGPREQTPADDQPDDEDRDLPDTFDEPAPSDQPSEPPAADVVPAAALVAACDGIVHRALERAGNRLRNTHRRSLNGATDCAPAEMHTCIDVASMANLDQLFDGAWDRVPEVAGMLGEDADGITDALAGYTRVLILTGVPHSWDRLANALGCGPELDCREELVA